jgi:D-beta-D-heptose 7-phosphate kinase/D-beta-D-heptose 1-phosphate adenosyltransferase
MSAVDLLRSLDGRPVLVVGDLILDEYVWGTVARISPEAPVPVVEVRRRSTAAGGAANTAANVAGLGGRVALVGVVGADAAGEQLRAIVRAGRVATADLLPDPSRPTTTKTRVIAHAQQVVRFDDEVTAPLPEVVRDALLSRVRELLPTVRACVLSDYGKGVVTADVAAEVIAAAGRAGVPVVVDPKGVDYRKYRGAAVVKPNQSEAAKVLNRDVPDDAAVAEAGRDLIALLGGATAVLITRGAAGMALFEPGRAVAHVPARAREVFDVTGAGDTVTGTLAIALAAGLPLAAGCHLAASAAAVVVGKLGTAPIDLDELRRHVTADDRPPGG